MYDVRIKKRVYDSGKEYVSQRIEMYDIKIKKPVIRQWKGIKYIKIQ